MCRLSYPELVPSAKSSSVCYRKQAFNVTSGCVKHSLMDDAMLYLALRRAVSCHGLCPALAQMAPKKGKKEEEEVAEAPVAPTEPVEEVPKARKVWSYGINNHVDHLAAETVQAFKGIGDFRQDFAGLCDALDIVGHHALLPEKDLEAPREAGPSAVLTLQSQLLDRASMLVMKAILPTSLHLDTLRLSGCSLDIDLLQLLREALTSETTVRSLHVEWNRMELALDDKIRESLNEAHHWTEIDEAEKSLFHSRAQRSLTMFREELESRQGGDVKLAIQRLSEHAVAGHPVTASLWPMDINSWVSTFYDVFHMDVIDCEPVFNILDSDYGDGDGFVPLARLQEVLEGLPTDPPESEDRLLPPAQCPEFQDEIGSAFGAFLDRTSPLEVISFRCCNLARLEVQAISSCLASPSPHLRALNLWGNKICDRGAQALAQALEYNFGLQFLGLGRNFVTHEGLRALCNVLGTQRLEEKAAAEKVIKHLKDQQKEVEKKRKAFGAPPKDANGRERYWPEPHLDTCEEFKDDSGTPFWIWTRNTVIKTVNVEQNPISDADMVERLQPHGTGALILRSTPCTAALLERQQKAKEQKASLPEDEEGPDESKGWTLILS
eukprot:s236_g29.t2